jgi:hypothetical protein
MVRRSELATKLVMRSTVTCNSSPRMALIWIHVWRIVKTNFGSHTITKFDGKYGASCHEMWNREIGWLPIYIYTHTEPMLFCLFMSLLRTDCKEFDVTHFWSETFSWDPNTCMFMYNVLIYYYRIYNADFWLVMSLWQTSVGIGISFRSYYWILLMEKNKIFL